MVDFSTINTILGTGSYWDSVQRVVPQAFKAIIDIISRQSEVITEMDRKLSQKVTRSEVNTAISTKANISEITPIVHEQARVQATQRNLASLKEALQDKVDIQDLVTMRNAIETVRADRSWESQIQDLEQEIYSQRSRIESMQHDLGKLHNETLTHREFNQFSQQNNVSTKEEIFNQFKPQIDELWSAKAEKNQVNEIRKNIEDTRRDEANELNFKINEEFENIRNDLKLAVNDIMLNLDRKVNLEDHQLLKNSIIPDIELKVNQEMNAAAANNENLQSQTFQDFRNLASETQIECDQIRKEMLLKVNVNDLCELLDGKSNIDDVNSEILRLHSEIENRLLIADFNMHIADQRMINESLCQENCSGRWIWQSGRPKANSQVPWEIEIVNTCPENFVWEKGSSVITTIAPGLYEVALGFFAGQRPNVQLLVNSEAVIVGESSAAAKQLGRHSAGHIVGTTMLDIVSIPANSRISVAYEGTSTVEGFLSLRKL